MYLQHHLLKLEYSKILEELSLFCVTEQGKNLCLSLLPSSDQTEVEKRLAETQEAIDLSLYHHLPSLSPIADISHSLLVLETYGVLSCEALLQLTKLFKLGGQLKNAFPKDDVHHRFPQLEILFEELYTNPNIIQTIDRSIVDENTIDDSASKTLQTIRKKERHLIDSIRNKLTTMIHSSGYAKYIQESVITSRNGRYVIPIKEEYRSQVKGLVHDISSSGSTVFIEPMSVFEWNNELQQLKIEEEREIEKILQELSKLFYPYQEELKQNRKIIGQLDFIFAKVHYAKKIQGNIPQLNNQKEIILKQAIHPLLDPKQAVPISLSLGKSYSCLVITGPNTGGKTVTLKTVGLLSAMVASGLAVPASSQSSFAVFDSIFADIGDDQSIGNSLSTFSSHLKNIIAILAECNENSLVLVDELGSGTDPIEGASLAISILNELQKRNLLCLATTHYQELKKYAMKTEGFENASVEFDLETLSPTYRLVIGVPGKSNAFAISEKLGLSSTLIEEAKNRLTKQDLDFETLVKQIYEDKQKIEQEKRQIEEELKEITALKQKLEHKSHLQEEKEQERIQKAKEQAREILFEAKEEASWALKEIKQWENISSKEAEKAINQIRNELGKSIKNVSPSLPSTTSSLDSPLSVKELKLGDEVWVSTLGQKGTILSVPNLSSKNKDTLVQVGNIKLSLPLSYLAPTDSSSTTAKLTSSSTHSSTPISTHYASGSKAKTAKTEINVIGYTVEEANMVVDKFLDDCSLAKLQTVRIVHGKGTGKLRQGIHSFLKKNPHVKSYRMGTFGEGEMGVTVVELT